MSSKKIAWKPSINKIKIPVFVKREKNIDFNTFLLYIFTNFIFYLKKYIIQIIDYGKENDEKKSAISIHTICIHFTFYTYYVQGFSIVGFL